MGGMIFIVNPIAGGGKAKELIPLIKSNMDKNNKRYKIITTKKPGEAIYIAKEQSKNHDIIVAVGGDGTVNEVATGLIDNNGGVLGIIPGGTGNDMARSLDIPMEPIEALEVLCKGYKRNMNIGSVNGSYFLNISSIGFDAEVVKNNINIKKKIKSGFSYAISVIYTLFSFKRKRLEINIDGEILNDNVYLLAVGNGKYYGGGMKILPMAKIDDGYLDICIVSNLNKLKLLFLFPTIFKGNHIKFTKHVQIYRGKNIKVKSKENLHLNIDGEIIPDKKEIEFSIEDKNIKVICNEK